MSLITANNRCHAPILLALAPPLLAWASVPPAAAQTAVAQEKVTPGDVVTKPLSDLNLKKDEVPQLLQTAREKPYDLAGLKRCTAIAAAVAELDAVLGDDIDVVRDESNSTIKVGSLAKSVVGSLIPFGGVIREISGANAQQRKWNEAIYAGSVRRAYLKGVGEQRGCAYPARPATKADADALWQAREAAASKDAKDKKADNRAERDQAAKVPAAKTGSVSFESRPVVQRTP